VKILIIEDQVMIRDFLVMACSAELEVEQIGQAHDSTSAISECRQLKPDLILLDLELPGADGLDLLPELQKTAPGSRVIALSSHTDDFTLHRVLRSNLNGFIDKNGQSMKVLPEAVDAVMSGRQFYSPVVHQVLTKLRRDPNAFDKLLSEREQAVLGQIGLGLSNSEIAEQLGISAQTVSNHRHNIMNKIGVHGTPRLIRYAIEKGFTRIRQASGAN
jgi:DNA-binding NarL/FixJ family response regulator